MMIRNFLPSLLFLLLSGFIFKGQAQNQSSPNDTANYPYYIEMMQNPDVNFFDVQRAFNTYWAGKEFRGVGSYKPFKRWEHFMRSRINPDGSRPAPGRNMEEYLKYFGNWNISLASVNGNWQELGPRQLPTNKVGQPNGLGRVNCIAVHPVNANTIFIGAPAGGLWKSTDHGQNWSSNTDALPTLGVSSIVIDFNNPSNMLIGTGDRDAGDAKGVGVMKSTDGGNTWSLSNTGMGNRTVNAMVQNPKNPSIILAATSTDIYKSYNGGNSWVKKSNFVKNFKDIVYKPGDSNIVYATAEGLFYRSTNAGESWLISGTGLPGATVRMVIAVTPADPSRVYVLATNQRTFKGFYTSTNNGQNFSLRSNSPNIMGYRADGSDSTAGQAWYDLCMVADTADTNVIYVGGINIFKSTDAGNSWSINAHWTGSGGAPDIHADQHCLYISKHNNRIYSGNDGGIYFTDDAGGSWQDISSGLAISQIYRLGQSRTNKNLVMVGYQDNGSGLYKGNGTWETVMGGDGMECLVDHSNSNYMYGELYYGDIRRSSNGGASFGNFADKGVNGITEEGDWVTPYIMQHNNPNNIFIGYKNVWRTTNARASTPSFVKISDSLANVNNKNMKAIEQCRSNTNVLYAAREDNKLFRTDSALLSNKPSWTDLSSSLPVAGATPTSIETMAAGNDSIVYITIDTKVYKSYNRGLNWVNITGTLPAVAMNCIIRDSMGGMEKLYVATDLGVFYRDSSLSDWIPFKNGLPSTAEVTEIEIYYDAVNPANHRIRAATYGRGLWESDLYESPTSPPTVVFSASDTLICVNETVNFTDLSTNLPNRWQWSFNPNTVTYLNGSTDSSQNPTVQFNQSALYTVSLKAYNSFGNNTLSKTNLISVSGGPSVTAGVNKNTICRKDSVLLSANGGVTYSWSPSFGVVKPDSANTYAKPNVSTTYIITGTDANGCNDTATVSVTVLQLPNVVVDPTFPSIAAGQSVTLTASGANTYSWTPPTGLNTTTGAVVQASPTVNTAYIVTGTDLNNCRNQREVTVSVSPNSVYQLAGLNNWVQFYPNPANHTLHVEFSGNGSLENIELLLINTLGQKVYEDKHATQQNTLKLDALKTGMYYLMIRSGGETLLSKPLSIVR